MKQIYLKILLTSIFTCCVMFVFAQGQKVSGIIRGNDGESIVGVTVLEKGTRNGTVSAVDGSYKIAVAPNAVLIYSFVGYKGQEIEVGNRTVIDVTLEDDMQQLQEVVVVGYGTQKKVNLSGAVENVDVEQLEKRPINNVAQGLQGAVPNLNIDFNSGEPGAAPKINIRGITSINGGDPLILIDGVPSDPAELNRLNPQDIGSMSVIKDASAAAIYGARAAFGVILITTKSGSDGMRINYSNYYSWDRPTILPEKITDPYIFLRLLETSTDNTPWDNVNYPDETYAWAKERSDNPSTPGVRLNPNDQSQWEYMGNRDWTDYFLADNSNSFNHQLSISGGSNKATYYLSASYNEQNGALKLAEDKFNRYTIRNKVAYKPFEGFTLGNNTYLTATKRKIPTYFDIWSIYNFFPTSFDKNPDGTWANSPVGNMGAQLTNGGTTTDDFNSLQSQFTAEYLFNDMLRFNADFTYRRGFYDYNESSKRYNIGFGPDDIREQGTNNAYKRNTLENYYIFNVYGTFNKAFGEHELTALAGYNQEFSRYNNFFVSRSGVISSSLPTVELATGDAQVGELVNEWALRGAFYRLNYIFKDKYILEFNGRYDGSSKFPKDSRFGFFPSYSAAWLLNKEPFMESVPVSLLKLRGSYGSLGNQAVSEYGYISTMDASLSDYLIGGLRQLEVSTPPLVSSNYTWEEVNTLNFGVDLGLFEDKILTSFDLYRRNTIGMLTLGKDLPDVLGAAEPRENAADLETNGWELSLAYKNYLRVAGKPMFLTAKAVLSDSRSYITKFENPGNSILQYYEGMEIGEIWGLTSDGLFENQEEIDALDQTSIIPWGALTITPGWPKYVDQDGNGIIEKGYTLDDTKDLSVIGNAAPRYRYGLNLGAEWNGFDLNVFLQGVGKRDYYPQDYLYWGFYQQPYAGGATHLLDFYRGQADSDVDRAKHSQAYLDAGLADQNLDAQFPHLQSWLADRNLGERIDEAQGLVIPQTRYLLNGAYARLKNLTLGYTLPQQLTERVQLNAVRLYVSGENLVEWSKLSDYFDPEAINDDVAQFNPAASVARGTGSGYAYPFQRRYAMGINITF